MAFSKLTEWMTPKKKRIYDFSDGKHAVHTVAVHMPAVTMCEVLHDNSCHTYNTLRSTPLL
jgi:hypothetical protein